MDNLENDINGTTSTNNAVTEDEPVSGGVSENAEPKTEFDPSSEPTEPTITNSNGKKRFGKRELIILIVTLIIVIPLIVSGGVLLSKANSKDFTSRTVLANNAYKVSDTETGTYTYFRFTPSESGTYYAYTTGYVTTSCEVYKTAVKKSNAVTATNLDTGINAKVSVSLTAGEVYYFAVKTKSTAISGVYSFYVSQNMPS